MTTNPPRQSPQLTAEAYGAAAGTSLETSCQGRPLSRLSGSFRRPNSRSTNPPAARQSGPRSASTNRSDARHTPSRRGCRFPSEREPRRTDFDPESLLQRTTAPAASCSVQDCSFPGILHKSAGARTATRRDARRRPVPHRQSNSERRATSCSISPSRRPASGPRRPTRRPVSTERWSARMTSRGCSRPQLRATCRSTARLLRSRRGSD